MSPKSANWTWLRRLQGQEQKYEYDTLPSHGSMRIITLLPDTYGGEICCHLDTVEITEVENTYEAISYVWGNPEYTVDIMCNGRRVPITVNLADALQTIRDSKRPKRLWVDAICINQKNDEEKGHQVKRMGNVYENAKRVLVWLGHDKEGIAKDSFKLIQETNKYMDKQLEKYGHELDIPTIVKPYPICSDKARWAKVNKLNALPWFKRVWVIQEAGLAKACVLLWGQERMDIAELMELTLWKSYREDLSELSGAGAAGFLNDVFSDVHCTYENAETWRKSMPLIKAKSQKCGERKSLFLDTLVAGSGMLAFDDRDHIYALLGSPLARHLDGQLIIEPDYGKQVHDVYFDTACALLQHPREAPYLLARVKHRSADDVADRAFPSWMPRWDTGWVQYTISRPKFWYQAGGSEVFQTEIRKNKCLALRGFIFDRISWTSRIIHEHNLRVNPDEWDDEFVSIREPFIDSLWKDAVQASPHSVEQLEDHFSYTLVRGYPADSNHKINKVQHHEEFAAYRHLVRSAAKSDLRQTLNDVSSPKEQTFPRNFLHRIYYCAGLRLVLTESNRFGLAPHITQPGDSCCIFPGVSVPMILRPTAQGKYNLIGESYIHGVMAGEAMEQLKEGKFKEEIIVIE
jgi:hypothetical protein